MKNSIKILITLFFTIAVIMPVNLFSQDTTAADTVKYWTTKGNVGVTFNQISFTNWAKGGENSYSGTGFLNAYADYKTKHTAWNSYMLLAYGLQQMGETGQVRKSDDKIDLNSKIGWKQWTDFYWTFLANFKSQFTKGYEYPNDSVFVSKFFAPAYLIASLGGDYKPYEYLSIYLSPFTGRYTFVSDTSLSQKWGVEPGRKIRPEFGWYFTMVFNKTDVIENVSVTSKLNLFQNYTDKNRENRKNIDVDWEFMTIMKISKYLSANFKCQILYDHDIKVPIYERIDGVKTKVGEGPRTQFMEQFGIGIVFSFE